MSTVTNNRISAMMDPFVIVQVRDAFQTLSNHFPFLVGLNPEERSSLPKMNVVNKQFVSDAFYAIQNNPTMFPPFLSAVELNKDLTLFNQLDEFVTMAQQLTEKLRDTQILAGSEAYVASLAIYKSLGTASNAGMIGADTIYEQLGERFAGQGSKAVANPIETSSN